ncbi:hypothetical protein WH87_04705 [Devosia epidermidihirudinis]|uniref:Uncharacterized protein n=1 Tax=Devosia epidermidihirudinis TaxID=1293439 RepID=A0A0F5QET0_9HYPH|nr:hypothetical protein [Devosia epidermidihirudinis]KKC39502.1 hypothetical protein WH87_04705 [Devosia epidermidihirudinis]
MALPSILPVASFADLLNVTDVSFVQGWQQQRSATASGETRYADRAPSLWKASVTTGPSLHAEAEGLMSLINSRAGGLKTALLFNHKLPFPSSDPDGARIAGYTPKLGVVTDRLHVAFTGFRPGYVLPLGTYFGIIWDTSRYYLGQLVEARTANPVTGAVAATEIWPPLPASISGTPNVIVSKPCGKFRVEPGSAFPSTSGALHTSIKFSAEQTYSR